MSNATTSSNIVDLAPHIDRSAKEKESVKCIKSEIVSMLEDKLEELRRESEKVKGTMEAALGRIGTQGFDTKLDDLRSGGWYRLKSEVATLQDVLAIVQAYID